VVVVEVDVDDTRLDVVVDDDAGGSDVDDDGAGSVVGGAVGVDGAALSGIGRIFGGGGTTPNRAGAGPTNTAMRLASAT
jgi:hypothetical protein